MGKTHGAMGKERKRERVPIEQIVLKLLFRVEAERGGTGKGHFLEGHRFEGCCFRKLRRFYVENEAVESEGRKDEQRAGWGHRS